MKNPTSLVLALVVQLLGLLGHAQGTINPMNPPYADGKIYLKMKQSSATVIYRNDSIVNDSAQVLQAVFNTYSVNKTELPFAVLNNDALNKSYRISFLNIKDTDKFIAALYKCTSVEYAEKVPAMYTTAVPNDPTVPYHLALVNANLASNVHIATGAAIVAIVDDAVLTTHEDLAANIGLLNRDVADLDNNPDPPLSGIAAADGSRFAHGTHVAGIAGAVTNNGTGVASIGWNNRIMAIKARQSSDPGNGIPFAYDGLAWAAANGAHVINMSWGGTAFSQTEYNVVVAAKNLNCVLVAAAGNNYSSGGFYPAAYGENTTGQTWEANNKKLVVAVAALDQNNDRSNWGAGIFGSTSGSNSGYWVDISAYGTGIISSIANSAFGSAINNQYSSSDGTSMAAPIVSGIAGIMRSYNMAKTADQIIDCLLNTANPDIYNTTTHPVNVLGTLGTGRVDAYAALRCLGVGCPNSIAVISPSSYSVCPGGTVTLTANTGSSYLWSTGAAAQSVTVSLPGVYTVTMSFPGGCTASSSVTISPTPTVAHIYFNEVSGIAPNDGQLCGQDFLGLYTDYGTSYAWSGFGATANAINYINAGSSIPFTFSIGITISGLGGCPGVTGTATASMTWHALPVVSASASPTLLCFGQSSTLTAGGASTYTWQPGGLLLNPVTVTPPASTIYTVRGVDINGCANTQTVAVAVSPTVVIAGAVTSCPNASMSVTASNAATYTWSPGGSNANPIVVAPAAPTVYSVTGTSTSGCVSTATVLVNPVSCCSQGAAAFVSTSGAPAAGVYYLNNPLTLTSNMYMSNITIFMGSNAEIIIPNGVYLYMQQSHLLSCSNMWKGIKLMGPAGSIIVTANSMIEDAITGIDATNVTVPASGFTDIICLNNATFNKNFTSVSAGPYLSNSAYPQYISNTAFTCRQLITSDHSTYLGMGTVNYNWTALPANGALKGTSFTPSGVANNTGVSTADLFSAAGYASAPLQAPYAGSISRQAILLTNVGSGSSFSANTFFLNGGTTYTTLNLFDNMSYGINALNSNVKASNCAFQNISQYATTTGGMFPLTIYIGGAGICSQNTTANGVYNLDVLPGVMGFNTGGNFFFNNVYGVYANNIQNTTIRYAMIHSSRVYNNTLLATWLDPGEHGIYLQNPDYLNINVSDNAITNVNTGISFYASSAAYPAGSHLKNLGQVAVYTNTVQADYAAVPAAGKAILNAIIADNLFNCAQCLADDNLTSVRVMHNSIKSAFRGIKSSNWQHQHCFAANNIITLAQEPNGFHNFVTTQYGILHQNNFNDIVNSNNITGFGIAKTKVYAIMASDNTSQAMLCNATANTYEGFYFSGAQNTVTWQKNTMQSHAIGMDLDNTVIGQQGSASGACDNAWLSTGLGWGGTNYQTYVRSSSPTTDAVNSKLHVKNNSVNRPSNNGSGGAAVYQVPGSLLLTSGSSPYSCPSQGGGGGSSKIAASTVPAGEALSSILAGDTGFGLLSDPISANARQSIYNYARMNPGVLSGNTAMQNFIPESTGNNFAKLMAVEDQLVMGQPAAAFAFAMGIATQNKQEASAILLYTLALKVQNHSFTAKDDAALLKMASGCAATDGLAVYQARVLYNSVHNLFKSFEDNCAAAEERNAGTINDAANAPGTKGVSLYPNPGKGAFAVRSEKEDLTGFTLNVYDISGKQVHTQRLANAGEGSYKVEIGLLSGIYIVEIVSPSAQAVSRQKLCVMN